MLKLPRPRIDIFQCLLVARMVPPEIERASGGGVPTRILRKQWLHLLHATDMKSASPPTSSTMANVRHWNCNDYGKPFRLHMPMNGIRAPCAFVTMFAQDRLRKSFTCVLRPIVCTALNLQPLFM